MRNTITFDFRDIAKFELTCKVLGEKTALKAARKAALKGRDIAAKAVRKAAPKGKTGQLSRGFKKKAEKSRLKGKFVHEFAMDPAKNDIFQKPIKQPGLLGGKNPKAYYPSSIEYGFLARASGGGYSYTPGSRPQTKTVEGTHFARDAAKAAEPSVIAEMKRVLNEELDKEWMK